MNTFNTEETTENGKPRWVNTFRYIRPQHDEFFPENKYEEHSNLYGITIIYDIDYKEKIVYAAWSVANGVNFNRIQGIAQAVGAPTSFCVSFPLESVDTYLGLNNALIHHIALDVYGEDVDFLETLYSYADIQKLFMRASNHYRNSLFGEKQ